MTYPVTRSGPRAIAISPRRGATAPVHRSSRRIVKNDEKNDRDGIGNKIRSGRVVGR